MVYLACSWAAIQIKGQHLATVAYKLLTQNRSTILLVERWRIPELNAEWLEEARKKAPVLSLTLATFSVEKVPERRKYGMSDRSVFESEKEKAEDFQPTKKCRTKPVCS